MNAIELLKQQHRQVEDLFEQIEDAAEDEQQALFDEIADQLAVHAEIEEQHFYPVVKREKTEDMVLESLQEHLQIKRLIADLLELEPDDEQFMAKIKVLEEEVEHHVEEEEHDLFPKVEALLGKAKLEEIGTVMEDAAEELRERGAPRLSVPEELQEHAPT